MVRCCRYGLLLLLFFVSSSGCMRLGWHQPPGDAAAQLPFDRSSGEKGSLDGAVGDGAAGDGPAGDGPPSDAPPRDLAAPDRLVAPLFVDSFESPSLNPAWVLWRTQFQQSGGRLNTRPLVRPGFNYGHGGNGRGAQASVGIGDKSWQDYRLSFTVTNTGVDPSFDPHALGSIFRGVEIFFRLAKATESWNDPASNTGYVFGSVFSTSGGTWSLVRFVDNYIPGTGWSATQQGDVRTLAQSSAKDPILSYSTNQFVVEVRGPRLTVSANGKLLVDHVDTLNVISDFGVSYGPVLHGGVAVRWSFETMGWIDDFRVDPL